MRKNESKIRYDKVYRLKRESANLGPILCFAIGNTTIYAGVFISHLLFYTIIIKVAYKND